MTHADTLRREAVALLHDRIAQTFALGVVLAVVVFAWPIGTPATRASLGRGVFLAPFLVLAVIAPLVGLHRIEDREERRFWRLVAASAAVWLAMVLAWAPAPYWPDATWYYLLVDLLCFAFYLPLLLAVEWRPHQGPPSSPWEPERWTHVIAGSLVVLGWFAYLAAIPALYGVPYYGSVLPTLVVFVALDLGIAALYVVVARHCRDPRWRTTYLGIGASLLAVAGTDTLDTLVEAGVLDWALGEATDLIWILPIASFVMVARLRLTPRAAEPGSQVTSPESSPTARARSGAMVLLGAFSFPLLHLWLQSTLPATSPAVTRTQGIVVLVMLGLMGALSVVMYRLLGGSHRRLADTQYLLFERLREAQRMEAVGQLAGGVAHDFNNVLTSIVGYNDMALQGLPPGDPNRPALEQIAASARRASELTQQLLALSRRQILKPEPVDLQAIVTPLAPVLARTLGEQIRVATDLAPDLPPVLVDPSQIRGILLTLAANARDAMPGGGAITIAARTGGSGDTRTAWPSRRTGETRYVELTVQDTGPYIPLADQVHLFEPFFVGGGKGRGAGLSLAAVQGAVTQSGGTIDIRSEPGQGATFVVRLPVAAVGRSR